MKSVEYWKRRAEKRIYESLEKSEKAASIIALVYAKAAKYLMKLAEGIFSRFQDLEGLTEAEALLMLQSLSNKNDIDELIRKIESEEAERLAKNAAAYLARLRRLKRLFAQMNDIMVSVYKQELKVVNGVLAEIADDSYLKTLFDIQQRIDVGFSVDHIDQKRLDTILNMEWSGKHYSERIWGNTQRLGEAVEEQMLEAALTGKSEDKIAVEIEKEFGKGAANARRLVRTESAYVSGEVNAAAYEDAEIEQYIFLATLDLKTSEACRKMDGKRFKLTDKKTGENYPPLHPFCRSTTISFIDEEYLENMKRTMRNPVTEKNEKVPLTMTYEEWHKKYVEGNAVAEAKEKSLRNKSADKKQYQKYKEVLGEEAPESLEEFQELKYTDEKKWNEMKHTYRIANMYESNSEKKMPASKIAELHEKIQEAKSNFNSRGRSGCTGVMEIDGEKYVSNSKLTNDSNSIWYNYKGDKSELVGEAGENKHFTYEFVYPHTREVDAEYKLYENAANIADKSIPNNVYIMAEYPMCKSCQNVTKQFETAYPSVNLYAVSKKKKEKKNNSISFESDD